MQDSTKNMSLVALSNRYKESISRVEGAIAEALNEIQFCDFLWSPSYNEDWPQFVSAKKSVAEADNIFSYILFGVDSLDNATMLRLKLPKHQGVILKKSKLDSLAKKFFSIPSKYLSYYPSLTAQLKELEKRATLPGSVGSKRKNGMDDNKGLVKRRRVGRPKKEVLPIASVGGTPSILTFFGTIKGVE